MNIDDKEFYEWARTHPADVSAIGVIALLDEIDRLQSLDRWISVSERLPISFHPPVWASCKYKNVKEPVQLKATYIAQKSVLSEDFLSDEIDNGECDEYDEEKDCYWVKEGWWEYSEEAEYNYQISGVVTHWRPLPVPPMTQRCESEE